MLQNTSQKKIRYIQKVKRPVVRPCPCAAGHISCNYVVISHILGCPFNCSYCFLHTFYGKNEIVVYDNEEDILEQLSNYMISTKDPSRFGTGEYSDSLALDRMTGLSKQLIELFAGQDMHLLELKTKSVEVDHLLDLTHNRKTIFAWSVNPEKMVNSDEERAASLAERIEAAKRCSEAGYPVAFHFDPLIRYPGWEADYKEVVDRIFSSIDHKNIAWISLGALRFDPAMKELIKERFPGSSIDLSSLEAGDDGKMRYPKPFRASLFQRMQRIIRSYSRHVYLYLCMEGGDVWEMAGLTNENENPYSRFFRFFKQGVL